MNAERRFFVDEKGYIVDTINPTNSGLARAGHEEHPQTDRQLRERLLQVRLMALLETLFFTPMPMQKLPDGTEYEPINEEASSASWPIFNVITASHLNSFDPEISTQRRFNGQLKRKKLGIGDFSSLELFCDDVEYMLRDLYGDIEDEPLDSIRYAVFCIVDLFMAYARQDLYNEHHEAVDVDYMFGIGLPEGHGISSSMARAGMVATENLAIRVREVLGNPSAFSDYTVRFAKQFSECCDVAIIIKDMKDRATL
jgi:hypothetical protein